MTRLVFDTNALRRGHFSIALLRQWMDAVGSDDVDFLVPEIVIWEWAEHAASAHVTLQSQLQEFRVDPGLYDRPTLGEEVSSESLVRRIQELLPRSIRVWSPPTTAWAQAIKDQVLQVGAGERREGVKTGAADSIVLACVQEQVDDRRATEAVLLATNDKHLQRVCSRLFGEEVLSVGNIGDLLNKLNSFEPAREDLHEEVEEALRRLIVDSGSEIGAALDTLEMGFRIHVSAEASARIPRPAAFRDLARLGRVDIVELHDLRVANQEGEGRVGLADVRIFADVYMTRVELRDTTSGTSEWVTTFDGAISGAFIDLTLAIVFDRHWNLQSVSPAGPAIIVFDEYDDEDDSEDVPPFHSDTLSGSGS